MQRNRLSPSLAAPSGPVLDTQDDGALRPEGRQPDRMICGSLSLPALWRFRVAGATVRPLQVAVIRCDEVI